MGGVYQITTGSYNSVIDINSGLDYVRALVGRICLVPLKLRREQRETHHDGKRQTHWTMTLTLDADPAGINKLREITDRILERTRYQIEKPIEENPALAAPDIIIEEEEAESEVAGKAAPQASQPGKPANQASSPETIERKPAQEPRSDPGPTYDTGGSQALDVKTLLQDYEAKIKAASSVREVSEVVNEALEENGFGSTERQRLIAAQKGRMAQLSGAGAKKGKS